MSSDVSWSRATCRRVVVDPAGRGGSGGGGVRRTTVLTRGFCRTGSAMQEGLRPRYENPPLYSVYCTVREMLSDRGYVVVPAAHKTREQYTEDYCDEHGHVNRARLEQLYMHSVARTRMRVLFYAPFEGDDNKLGVKRAKPLIERAAGADVDGAIVIVPASVSVSSTVRKLVAEVKQEFRLEWFTEEELGFNVGRRLKRTRRVMADVDATLLRKVYVPPATGRKRYLPAVNAELDPMARYYGARDEQVLSTMAAPSETAGRYSTHRVGE